MGEACSAARVGYSSSETNFDQLPFCFHSLMPAKSTSAVSLGRAILVAIVALSACVNAFQVATDSKRIYDNCSTHS